ncbi:MAG: aminodeoxychorismate/anthranilate synthase component II [Planctomycetes bacterium]|nr:aminodeoxychorismate/anthranilate synthase component II [Planctomycetota bacterium]
MILLIDNYDSFTWNLVQRIGELDPSLNLNVVRNDRITPEEAVALRPSHVIISPGPCSPTEAGVSNDMIRAVAGKVPLLGVCLGHQCMGHVHGMTVTRNPKVMHGKTSLVHHDGTGLFAGVPNPFVATRYHSLVVLKDTVPSQGWQVSAWTTDTFDDGTTREVVMGLRRIAKPGEAPMEGVQFHPESFLTVEGPKLLANFLGLPAPVLAAASPASR